MSRTTPQLASCRLVTDSSILGEVTMATIDIVRDEVVLRLSRMEALEAGHLHSAVRAPTSAVQSVEGVDDPWPHLQGHKDLGTEIPGGIMVGTRGGVVCAVHKHGPAGIVTFDPAASTYGRWVGTGDINDVPSALSQPVGYWAATEATAGWSATTEPTAWYSADEHTPAAGAGLPTLWRTGVR